MSDLGCLCCGKPVDVGALCKPCATEVAPCDGLIADHLHSTVDPEDAAAWMVDGFGTPHALAAKSTLGRAQDGQLVILASSVSREHARLERAGDSPDAPWTLRDLGSRNGTFLDGARLATRASLPTRALVKVGDVALWFLAQVAYEPAEAASFATATAGGGLVRYLLAPQAGGELCIVGRDDDAGALLARARPTDAWTERPLARLEFQLLRALCARYLEEGDSPSAIRGCVSTKQLARDLPFQSRFANEENVRQVVRRLRGELGEVGAASLLAVAPGRGYYLACPVTLASTSRS